MVITSIDKKSGLPKLCLSTAGGATAEVFLHGAHVTSWTVAGQEQLFLSDAAVFEPPKAIRGGVPICFPQFSDMGPLPQHGFARNHPWKVVESPVDSPLTAGASIPWVVLELQLNKEDADERVRTWANSSTCRLRVALGEADGSLSMQMTVSNTGQAPLSFTFAFHTYYATDDISKVSVRGLQGCDYLDNLQARIKLEDAADSITFAQEVDRIYLDAPDSITVVDAGKSRPLQLRKQGLPDAVVWNPWEAKAKSTKDLKDDDYLRMFCVESGVMGVPVTLPPGQTWQGVQQVCVL
eukprot:jgi/Mesvir1/15972/Mv26462-RA.1